MNAGVLLPLLARFAEEEGAHAAATWLGVPLWIWQSINLVLFFFLLYKFVIRKLIDLFRQKQVEVDERLKLAQQQRHDAERVADEIRERMSKVEREVEAIRAQGRADGEAEKAALFARAEEEGQRVRRDAEALIVRRAAAAVEELKGVAADLTAEAAREIVAKNVDESDRNRLFEEGVQKLGEVAR